MAGPIERKVTWATGAAYLGSLAGLAILQGISDTQLGAALPDVVEPFVLALLPALSAFFAGKQAKHTPRPDLLSAHPEVDLYGRHALRPTAPHESSPR